MDKNQYWLIYYKANFSENSSLNMDGSTYVFGVAAVPVKDLKKALELFDFKLQESAQQLIEIYKCVLGRNLSAPHELDLLEGIRSAVEVAVSSQKIYLSVIGNKSLD